MYIKEKVCKISEVKFQDSMTNLGWNRVNAIYEKYTKSNGIFHLEFAIDYDVDKGEHYVNLKNRNDNGDILNCVRYNAEGITDLIQNADNDTILIGEDNCAVYTVWDLMSIRLRLLDRRDFYLYY